MSAVITSGPAANGRQKTRSTEVIRHAFFVPWDDEGKGGWRYLPVDTVHQATIQGVDPLGNPTRAVDVWTHKGYIPVEMIPEDDPRLDRLPLNWREHALYNAEPQWRVEPAVVKDSVTAARDHWVERAESAED